LARNCRAPRCWGVSSFCPPTCWSIPSVAPWIWGVCRVALGPAKAWSGPAVSPTCRSVFGQMAPFRVACPWRALPCGLASSLLLRGASRWWSLAACGAQPCPMRTGFLFTSTTCRCQAGAAVRPERAPDLVRVRQDFRSLGFPCATQPCGPGRLQAREWRRIGRTRVGSRRAARVC